MSGSECVTGVLGFFLGTVVGTIVGFLIFNEIGRLINKNVAEVGYCQVEETIYCINGKLMNKNPSFNGYDSFSGYQSTFLPVSRYADTFCSCKDLITSEDSKLLSDLKESVNK